MALDRYKEGIRRPPVNTSWTRVRHQVRHRTKTEPPRNILLPTGPEARWPSSRTWNAPELVSVNPRTGHEQMANLNLSPR